MSDFQRCACSQHTDALIHIGCSPPLRRAWAADNPAHFYKQHPIAEANQLYLLVYMALVVGFICLLLTRDSVFGLWAVR